jgi:ribosomal protein S12 methylthiotransferase accessory factor
MSSILELNDAIKNYNCAESKLIHPKKTIKKIKEIYANSKIDVFNKIEKINNDEDFYRYRCIGGRGLIKYRSKGSTYGKGITSEQAMASGLMELAERYSFYTFINTKENFIKASYSDITQNKIDIKQYLTSIPDLNVYPNLINDLKNLPLNWCQSYSLKNNEKIMVPLSWFYFLNETNGAAAGNCIEEAIIHGFCEVIERHVASTVKYKKLKTPSIKKNSIDDPLLQKLISKFNHINIIIKDFTLNFGIPSLAIVAYDPINFSKSNELYIVIGTSPNKKIALIRALTELYHVSGGFSHDKYWANQSFVTDSVNITNNLEDYDYLFQNNNYIDYSDVIDCSDKNFKTEIENCSKLINEKNLEAYVINTTNININVPSVFVVIPGSFCYIDKRKHNIYEYIGRAYQTNGDYKNAIKYLKKATKIKSGNLDLIYLILGLCYYKIDEYQNSIDNFNMVIKLNPNSAFSFAYIGQNYKKLGNENLSKANFKKSLKIDPNIKHLKQLSFLKN